VSVAETPVGAYLEELAGSRAVPGGGSAAAVAAAMGAALFSMVARISARKVAGAAEKQELESLVSTLDRMVQDLVRLSQDDIDAYRSVLEARKSGAADATGGRLISDRVERAARVPLETAKLAGQGLGIEQRLRPLAWQMVRSDLETGHHLLLTGLRGALLNVEANLPDLAAEARLPIERDHKQLTERHLP
jgi:formiminotetrahydrofolate cyclodeaminase